MDEKIRNAVKTLAENDVRFAQQHQRVLGEFMTLSCAVYALVRTHPDPVAFAREMRRSWQQLGQPHADASHDPALLAGISAVLNLLEEACAAPLHLRPPGQAFPPLQEDDV